ncbi:hypothetical protein NECID01_1385 [Nematocida sp. AWRm77]|nr:hypothetical protein NECID01_1385 [Nematocida sp. AWRm77]
MDNTHSNEHSGSSSSWIESEYQETSFIVDPNGDISIPKTLNETARAEEEIDSFSASIKKKVLSNYFTVITASFFFLFFILQYISVVLIYFLRTGTIYITWLQSFYICFIAAVGFLFLLKMTVLLAQNTKTLSSPLSMYESTRRRLKIQTHQSFMWKLLGFFYLLYLGCVCITVVYPLFSQVHLLEHSPKASLMLDSHGLKEDRGLRDYLHYYFLIIYLCAVYIFSLSGYAYMLASQSRYKKLVSWAEYGILWILGLNTILLAGVTLFFIGTQSYWFFLQAKNISAEGSVENVGLSYSAIITDVCLNVLLCILNSTIFYGFTASWCFNLANLGEKLQFKKTLTRIIFVVNIILCFFLFTALTLLVLFHTCSYSETKSKENYSMFVYVLEYVSSWVFSNVFGTGSSAHAPTNTTVYPIPTNST